MNLEVVFPFSREKRMLVHGAPALHRLPGKGRNSQSLRVCHQGVGGRRVVEGRIQPPYLQLVFDCGRGERQPLKMTLRQPGELCGQTRGWPELR